MGELVLASVADAAAALAHAASQARAAEVAQCLAVAALCDLHTVDDTVLVDGAERWVPGGGDGTPLIGEFVAGEVACLLGVGVGSAFAFIARVLNVRHRHPTLWRLFIEGDVRWWDAARVADAAQAARLDASACHRLDHMCAHALALQPWGRVRAQVEKWILLADPAQAARNQQAAADHRYVHVGGLQNGHVGVWGQLDAADGLALDEALNGLAGQLGDGDLPHRRATALGVLARSALGQHPLPTSTTARTADLVVHLTSHDLHHPEHGVATLDRWGHVLLPRLRHMLDGCHVRVRPVVAGADLPAVDSYQVPDAMRLALNVRNPVDVFPWGTRRAAACQADHTIPYDHTNAAGAGQTHVGNLGPLSGYTHRLKTHGGWHLDQPAPGTYRWTSPLGYQYAVTSAGTIRTGSPPPTGHEWWRTEPPDDHPPPDVLDDPGPRRTPLPRIA